MKKLYITFVFILTVLISNAQGYTFGIVHISGYNFKVVAIPDFTSTGNTDVSDVGFTLVLPAGTADAVNPVGLLTARTWSVAQHDAANLTAVAGLGDGTKDVFQFNLPPGQSILAHTAGQQIDLVSFDVSNSPVTGVMSILLNSDPIATGAGGVFDSFYNSDIDGPGVGTGTTDYFAGLAPGMESINFSTLAVQTFNLEHNVAIYPNPTSNYIHISSSLTFDKVALYDVLGKQVLSTKNVSQLKVDQLHSGLYFLKLSTKTGDSAIKKIIIK
ncbi:T9SS type A sorting domain-containing protein [Lutibacter sp.]|uniref:T9SS type A sorting domain-containing protein n=1 Tax=Lutibacter sp. TaxID=1925666 RepID=UPI0025BCFB7F|nr:T9SS type A sorting domain-containing protein [Lutibacter sp.]MCF6182596.1 T9SS type A sorting domain-containing protein [Lutibacter sp.]